MQLWAANRLLKVVNSAGTAWPNRREILKDKGLVGLNIRARLKLNIVSEMSWATPGGTLSAYRGGDSSSYFDRVYKGPIINRLSRYHTRETSRRVSYVTPLLYRQQAFSMVRGNSKNRRYHRRTIRFQYPRQIGRSYLKRGIIQVANARLLAVPSLLPGFLPKSQPRCLGKRPPPTFRFFPRDAVRISEVRAQSSRVRLHSQGTGSARYVECHQA